MNTVSVFRGRVFHFIDDPNITGDSAHVYYPDGLLVVEDGKIARTGHYADIVDQVPSDVVIEHYPNHLMMPGFVDTHIHYPQTQMIGAYGEQLLSWLEQYTFPTEQAFADYDYALKVSRIFLDELLRNGTTTALVFGTVHPESIDAFFGEAQRRQLRMIAGKVLMDRNAPDALCDTAESGYAQSKALIEKWHKVDRLLYAVTPRFAPTSTDEQLAKAGQLLKEYPDVYLHTHLAENTDEIEWVKSLFPGVRNYLDVYKKHGLLTKNSVFAHGVHLCEDQCGDLASHQSAIAHCPTSNLFLGSGLFDYEQLKRHKVSVGLGTDVGAGTSFSMFKTMDEAYKIQQLNRKKLDPFTSFYLATRGGAKALNLEDKIGSFEIGNEADFVILDLAATPLLRYRTQFCQTLHDLLFSLSTLGDDRLIQKTYALGRCVHNRDEETA